VTHAERDRHRPPVHALSVGCGGGGILGNYAEIAVVHFHLVSRTRMEYLCKHGRLQDRLLASHIAKQPLGRPWSLGTGSPSSHRSSLNVVASWRCPVLASQQGPLLDSVGGEETRDWKYSSGYQIRDRVSGGPQAPPVAGKAMLRAQWTIAPAFGKAWPLPARPAPRSIPSQGRPRFGADQKDGAG
jgi:hypothetical protein